MAAFAGCTDARNSRVGKVLSVLLAGSLSLSFLNITALAAPAYAEGEEDAGITASDTQLYKIYYNAVYGNDDFVELGQNDGVDLEHVTGATAPVNPGYRFVAWRVVYPDTVQEIESDGATLTAAQVAQVLAGIPEVYYDNAIDFVAEFAVDVNEDDENPAPTQDVLHQNPVTTYTFVADMDGHQYALEAATQICVDGDHIALPEPPIFSGYEFIGWTVPAGVENAETPGAYKANVTDEVAGSTASFVANYKKINALTFVDNAGKVVATKIPQDNRLTQEDLDAVAAAYQPYAGEVLVGWAQDSVTLNPVNLLEFEIDNNYVLYPVTVPGTWVQPDSADGTFVPSVLQSADGTPVESEAPEGDDNAIAITLTEAVLNNGKVNQQALEQQLLAEKPEVANYAKRFLGWYYVADGNYRPFNMADDQPGAGFQLVARWCPETVQVSYQEGDANLRDDLLNYYPDADVLVSGPANDSYASNDCFKNWTTTPAEGEEATTVAANSLAKAGDIAGTLTAVSGNYLEIATDTVTFNPNYAPMGAEDNPVSESVTVSHNGELVIPGKPVGVHAGLKLAGWTTDQEGKGFMFTPGDVWRAKVDTELYAQYVRDPEVFKLENATTDQNNNAIVEVEYTGDPFRVQLDDPYDNVLLSGEDFAWWHETEEGGYWDTSEYTFGPDVTRPGQEQSVKVGVITVDENDNTIHEVWTHTTLLRVTPAILTVAPVAKTANYGSPLPELSTDPEAFSVQGWKNDDQRYAADLFALYNFSAAYDLSTVSAATVPVGTYPITISYTTNSDVELNPALYNYFLDPQPGTLEVVQAGTSYIQGFVAPAFTAGSRIYDGTTSTVEAVAATEGATVQYSTDGGRTWTTDAPRMTNAGVYTVQARALYPDNANAAITERVYRIYPAPATINVNSASKNVFEADPVFTGTVTGLIEPDALGAVEYYRTNTSSVAGSYRVTARYTENPNYTVTVNPGVLTIRPLPTQVVPPAQDPIVPDNPTPSNPTPSNPTPSNPTPTNPGGTISGITVGSNTGSSNQGGSGNQGGTPTNQGAAANQNGTPTQSAPNVQYIIVPAQGGTTTTDNGSQNVITPAPADTTTTTAEATDPAPEVTVDPAADSITIDDAATPMASSGAPVYSPSTTIDTGLGTPEVIEDDNNPLGAFDEPICWVHWALLLGVMITAGFGIIVVRRRMAAVEAVAAMEAQMFGAAASDRPVYAPIPEYRAR